MKNNFFKLNNFIGLMILIMVLFSPGKIFASTISASADSSVSAGDTSIISVYLNTEGQNINSIEGSVTFSDEHNSNFEIRDISLVNSVMTMWPRKPSKEEGNKISFVGGTTSGVNGSNLLLFKIIVKINESGEFKVTSDSGFVYLSDGLGTSLSLNKNVSNISVSTKGAESKNKWEEIISKDNTAPLPFVITVVQDVNLYDGKKFISFETTDAESGVSHYEVIEGDYSAVRTGTNYVLIDQNTTEKDMKIIVSAYDKAGNFQIATLGQKGSINWLGIIVSLLIIISVYSIFKKIKNRKKKNAK